MYTSDNTGCISVSLDLVSLLRSAIADLHSTPRAKSEMQILPIGGRRL